MQNSKSLCDHPVGTLVAVERTVREDGGIAERFRTCARASGMKTRTHCTLSHAPSPSTRSKMILDLKMKSTC